MDVIKADNYEELIPYLKDKNKTVTLNINGQNRRIYTYLYVKPQDIPEIHRKWSDLIKDVPLEVKLKAGDNFINPYRLGGVYFAAVHSLYLLGSNEWHSFPVVLIKLQEIMSSFRYKGGMTRWDKFVFKKKQSGAGKKKDAIGRIVHTFSVLRRVDGFYPYGYKLKQFGATIEEKEESGCLFYKLNTKNETQIKDMREENDNA